MKGKEGYLLTTFQTSIEVAKQFLAEKLIIQNATVDNEPTTVSPAPRTPREEIPRTASRQAFINESVRGVVDDATEELLAIAQNI